MTEEAGVLQDAEDMSKKYLRIMQGLEVVVKNSDTPKEDIPQKVIDTSLVEVIFFTL